METLVSVCVPTLNRERSVFRLVESLLHSAASLNRGYFEVIVVDGSTNNHIRQRFAYTTEVRVLSGPGDAISARNIAARSARGQYLAFVDDDTWVSEAYFQSLNHSLSKIERVSLVKGIVGNTIRVRGESELDKAWLAAGFDRFFDLCMRSEYLRWGCTSNIVIKRSDFHALGGFRNSSVPVGGEDIDFGMRVTKHGVLMSDANLCVYHAPIDHTNLDALLVKAAFYGESEQWLAQLYGAYATINPGRYWLSARSYFERRTVAERIRDAFHFGGIRYSLRHGRFIRTISPLAMALDVDDSLRHEASYAMTRGA